MAESVAGLRIEIAKRPDGAGLLFCRRADGSSTWQKQNGRQAPHFVLHDLTHFAVETVLGYEKGFFGLIAQGWDIEDTTGKGSRGALPPEALQVERIVGLFDSERGSGAMWTTAEFNEFSPRTLSDADIQAIRACRAGLFRRWAAILPDQNLELTFVIKAADFRR